MARISSPPVSHAICIDTLPAMKNHGRAKLRVGRGLLRAQSSRSVRAEDDALTPARTEPSPYPRKLELLPLSSRQTAKAGAFAYALRICDRCRLSE
jgi:hypothetical protein